MRETLILFFKSPEAGRVKTRLARDLEQSKTLRVYRALLQEAVTCALLWRSRGSQRQVEFWGSGDASYWPEFGLSEARRQHGADLGARMDLAMREAFRGGAQKVAIMGCDAPELNVEDIERSFEVLNHDFAKASFVPCEDGGYALMACRELPPTLFVDLPWSSTETLERLMHRLEGFGLSASVAKKRLRDIDHLEDLKQLNYRPDLWA